MTQPLVDPQLAAFRDSDPSILPDQPPALVSSYQPLNPHKVAEVGIALAAAFLIMRRMVAKDLQDEPPQLHDSHKFIKSMWRRRAPIWMQLSVPAIRKGYEIGQITGLTQQELEVMAQSYAEDLGEYINETSSAALVQGFEEQLGAKWSEQLAWHRACAAFGLDAQQMRTYVRSGINTTVGDPQFELLPRKAQAFIDQAVMSRADMLGGHEAWQSIEVGKTLAWMAQKNAGTLPADAQKEWLTAADEKVCPQCGPLHRTRILVDEQFVTPDGNKYWAPGIHPRCRCEVKLIYPDIADDPWSMVTKAKGDDPYDRDPHGHFASAESRGEPQRQRSKPQPKRVYRPVAERPPVAAQAPAAEDLLIQRVLADVAQEEDAVAENMVAAVKNPYATTTNPYATPKSAVANPYASTTSTNPYAAAATANPYAATTTGNPYAATTNNPYAKTKRRAKQVLVILPDGTYGMKDVPVDDFIDAEDDFLPVYSWAADHYWHDSGWDQRMADSVRERRDEPINFNYTGAGVKPVTMGLPYHGEVINLIYDASQRYDDWDAFNDQDTQRLMQDYHRQWMRFSEQQQTNIEHNARFVLKDHEIKKILSDAGKFSEPTMDRSTLQDDLIFADPDSNVMHSYLSYMEQRALTNNPDGPDSPASKMEDIELELSAQGLRFHTPTVFIIKDPHQETDIYDPATGAVALGGKHRVVDTIYRSAEQEMGSERPDNIRGIRFVYLEPDDGDFSADPTEDEMTRNLWPENLDEDPQSSDIPMAFPGIDYWRD